MLGFVDNLSLFEILVVAVVAVIAFGGRLPEAAGQAAAHLQRLRRQLNDLRRESGIDREIESVRRAMEHDVPRIPRTLDVKRAIEREVTAAVKLDQPPLPAPATEPPPSATPPTPPSPPADAGQPRSD